MKEYSICHADTHSALVRFLASVSTHMYHQHILSFKWSLLTGAVLPVAHKFFLLAMDMLIIDVLERNTVKLINKQMEAK